MSVVVAVKENGVVYMGADSQKSNYFPLVIADTKTKEFKYIYEGEKVDERGDSI